MEERNEPRPLANSVGIPEVYVPPAVACVGAGKKNHWMAILFLTHVSGRLNMRFEAGGTWLRMLFSSQPRPWGSILRPTANPMERG